MDDPNRPRVQPGSIKRRQARTAALAVAVAVALGAPALRLAAAPGERTPPAETARPGPTREARLAAPTLIEGLPAGEAEGAAPPNPYAPPPAEPSPAPVTEPAASPPPVPGPEASPVPQAGPRPGQAPPPPGVGQGDPRNAPDQGAPSAFEVTAAAVERILTLRVNGVPLPRNVPLQVPVFYRSRTLALDRAGRQRVRAFQAKVKAAKARLHELNGQTAALLTAWKAKVARANAQNAALLKEWNQIVADYSPTAALMADSPSLPQNQGDDPVNRDGLAEGFQPGQGVEITPAATPPPPEALPTPAATPPSPETLPTPAANPGAARGEPLPENYPPAPEPEIPPAAARMP